MQNKTAIVFGSSGLIGGEVVKILQNSPHFEKVILPVRSINKKWNHPKLHQVLVNFDELYRYKAELKADVYFLCLGTTMAKAKTKEAFYKVDYTYTYEAASLASESTHILLVSSLGADLNSMVYYSRVKGEIEKAIVDLKFNKISIFRPSLLLGERTEFRTGERWASKISSWFSFLFFGPLKSYKPILASVVAESMVKTSLSPHNEKVKIFQSHQIEESILP